MTSVAPRRYLRRFIVNAALSVVAGFAGLCFGPISAFAEPLAQAFDVSTNADGRLEVFELGADSTTRHRWQSTDGSWGAAQSLEGHDVASLVSGRNADGRLELFALGKDGAVYHRWQGQPNGSFLDWQPLYGSNLRSLKVVSRNDGRMAVLALSNDGSVYLTSQEAPNGNWSSWSPLEGSNTTAIASGLNADGRLELFGLRSDGSVWHRWETSSRGAWGAWESLYGSNLTAIDVGRDALGRLFLFALSGDGSVYQTSQNLPNGGWGSWSTLAGQNLRSISVGSNGDGRLELFAVGGDGAVYHRWQTVEGPWDEWSPLYGENIKAIEAHRGADDRLHLFALSNQGAMYWASQAQPNGGWQNLTPLDGRSSLNLTYAELAAYWAPVISQDIDASNIRAEYITRFDFDGNWAGLDNWDIDGHNLPGSVYYWVTETQKHYFIGYAFFHPRDWSSLELGSLPPLEHVNDLEGVLLTIAKDPSARQGKFLTMITISHYDFYSYVDRNTPSSSPIFGIVAPSATVSASESEDIDGDVDFVQDDWGVHPVVYAEAEGHGVYGQPDNGYKVDDYAPIFRSDHVIDWRGVNWSGIVSPPKSGNPSEAYDTSSWDDGILYHYEGTADNPGPYGLRLADKLPHNFQIVGYELLSIGPLWARRADAAGEGRTFETDGSFAGGGANPPWNWDDTDTTIGDANFGGADNVPKGAFFNDPATLVQEYFDNLGSGPFWPLPCGYTGDSYGARGPASCP